MIRGAAQIREAYRSGSVADGYIEQRFQQPLGALLHRAQVRALTSLVAREQPARILEIAPGPARLTTEVARVCSGSAVIVDTSAVMLDQARRRLGAVLLRRWHPVQGDVFSLPVRPPFDFVYSFRLVRHFADNDRQRIYRQVHAVLRPGGMFVFDAVNERVSALLRAKARPGEYEHYDALMTPQMLRAELYSEGFEIVSMEGVQHRYGMLNKVQTIVAPRSARVAAAIMKVMESCPGGDPLEWIVTCRRA